MENNKNKKMQYTQYEEVKIRLVDIVICHAACHVPATPTYYLHAVVPTYYLHAVTPHAAYSIILL